MTNKVDLNEKLSMVTDYWTPKIVGELNNQHVKIAKLKGSFVWHHHDNEDELFMVLKGKLKIHLKEKTVHLNEGEFFIVPRGVEHKPAADEEVHILLFEPAGTLNTGNITNEMTVSDPESI